MIQVAALDPLSPQNRVPAEFSETAQVPCMMIEWDRAPGAFWLLRVCEYYGANGERWEYPPVPKWQRRHDGQLSYLDEPVSCDLRQRGTVSVSAHPQDDELRFTVTVTNQSDIVWRDAFCWVCLIHRYANAFQANCELPVGIGEQPWVPCAALRAPKGRWLKWCTLAARREISERIGRRHSNLWQPHVESRAETVRAWRMSLQDNAQQFVTLSSPDTVILGWSHWPCTDLGLFLGTLQAHATASVHGTLRFHEELYQPV